MPAPSKSTGVNSKRGVITSVRNPHVAYCRSLHRTRTRREAGAFLIEGLRLTREALAANVEIQLALYDPNKLGSSETGAELMMRLETLDSSFKATGAVVEAASATKSSAGLVLVAREPASPPLSTIDETQFLLILDGVSNPGNAGAILRSAAAAGLKLVALAGTSVDPYEAKVVRAGMGAHFRLRIIRSQWPDIDPYVARFDQAVGADARGDLTIYEVDWGRRTALVIGSEAHGLSVEARELVNSTARIPMAPGVESLNAAAVASIFLFQARKSHFE